MKILNQEIFLKNEVYKDVFTSGPKVGQISADVLSLVFANTFVPVRLGLTDNELNYVANHLQ